jgi:glycosyltransferase involved in cell wall biosynthesis
VDAQSCQLATQAKEPRPSLKLLLDARKLGDGGIGVYLENLICGLLDGGDIEITLLSRPGADESFSRAQEVAWLFDASPCYSLDELLFLGRRIEFSRYDIFHTPHYVLPIGVAIPSVVTVHDLIHIEQPERFFYPWVSRRLIRSSVARADRVLAVSGATRRAVLDLTGVDGAKVLHVPNAVAPFLKGPSSVLDLPTEVQGAGSFFLSVLSNLKPHKAPRDLLLAFRNFRRDTLWRRVAATCPKLVIAGYGAAEFSQSRELSRLAEEIGDVVVVGAVSPSQLSALYAKAAALVVPSRLEGFCLPALEAQSRGTPVVCRPIAALQELLTERDTAAADVSIDALAAAMRTGLECGAAHGRQPMAGHLERYSTRRVADEVRAVYEDALRSRGAR